MLFTEIHFEYRNACLTDKTHGIPCKRWRVVHPLSTQFHEFERMDVTLACRVIPCILPVSIALLF